MKKLTLSIAIALVASLGISSTFNASAAEELEKLNVTLPIPAFMGPRTDVPDDEHLEKPSDKPRPAFMVPKGCTNLALKKKVTGSVETPNNGTYALPTDGNKEFSDDSYVELPRKTQWIQIDLGEPVKMYAILVWHAHNTPHIYRDVIVQVSDDPQFEKEVKTVYNNDYDNSSLLGVGKDLEYYESHEGRLVDTKGVEGRYVRLYSRGSTYSSMNRYTEVEVWGLKK
jgi:hypothetical protein